MRDWPSRFRCCVLKEEHRLMNCYELIGIYSQGLAVCSRISSIVILFFDQKSKNWWEIGLDLVFSWYWHVDGLWNRNAHWFIERPLVFQWTANLELIDRFIIPREIRFRQGSRFEIINFKYEISIQSISFHSINLKKNYKLKLNLINLINSIEKTQVYIRSIQF